MTPAQSTTSRPWFICPSWAAVVPLLLHPLTTAPDSDEAAAAAAELQRLAEALDGWNTRGPALLEVLRRCRELLDDGESKAAGLRLSQALHLLEGEA